MVKDGVTVFDLRIRAVGFESAALLLFETNWFWKFLLCKVIEFSTLAEVTSVFLQLVSCFENIWEFWCVNVGATTTWFLLGRWIVLLFWALSFGFSFTWP